MKNKRETEKESWINKIIEKEYCMFDRVKNVGGRASCQNQKETFYYMRRAQFESWDQKTCERYYEDLVHAERDNRNLLSEKYGYMMEVTHPQEYEKIKNNLPAVSQEKRALIHEILNVYMKQTEKFMENYPAFKKRSRPVRKNDALGTVSIENYMEGELKTYSAETLRSLLLRLQHEEENERYMVYEIYKNMVRDAGYYSLEEVN